MELLEPDKIQNQILNLHRNLLELPHIPLNFKRLPLIDGWGLTGNRWNVEGRLKDYLDKYGRNAWNNPELGGLGLLTGINSNIIALDFDIDDKSLIDEILSEFKKDFLTIRKGNPKRLGVTFFKYEKKYSKKIIYDLGNNQKVELLTNGQMVALSPSWHNKHNLQYFDEKKPFILSYKDLPTIPYRLIEFLENKSKNDDQDSSIKIFTNEDNPEGHRHNNLYKLLCGLVHDVKDKKKLAVKLCEFDQKNHSKNTYFKNFNAAFLFVEKRLKGKILEDFNNPLLKIEIKESVKEEIEKKSVDYTSLIPPPKMGLEIYNYILDQSIIPRESFSFASTLALFSTLIGNKIQIDNTYSNAYYLLCAETGQGKDDPLKAPQEILMRINGENLIGNDSYGSATAMITGLGKQRVRLDTIDEASDLFSQINDKKNYHNHSKCEMLLKLFSSPGKFFSGKQNATDAKLIGRCYSPCVTSMMATTPRGLNRLNVENFEMGLGPRILFFYEATRRTINFQRKPKMLDKDILLFLKSFIAPAQSSLSINLNSEGSNKIFNVPQIKETQDTFKLRCDLAKKLEQQKNAEGNQKLYEILTRSNEYFNKLILMHHAMNSEELNYGTSFHNENLKKESLFWAFENLQIIYKNTKIILENLSLNSGKVEYLEGKNLFLQYIKSRNLKGLNTTKKDISNNFRRLPKNVRDLLLTDLVDTGEVLKKESFYFCS